jgi:hypothetical protein
VVVRMYQGADEKLCQDAAGEALNALAEYDARRGAEVPTHARRLVTSPRGRRKGNWPSSAGPGCLSRSHRAEFWKGGFPTPYRNPAASRVRLADRSRVGRP